jgi:hypothetical protein
MNQEIQEQGYYFAQCPSGNLKIIVGHHLKKITVGLKYSTVISNNQKCKAVVSVSILTGAQRKLRQI